MPSFPEEFASAKVFLQNFCIMTRFVWRVPEGAEAAEQSFSSKYPTPDPFLFQQWASCCGRRKIWILRSAPAEGWTPSGWWRSWGRTTIRRSIISLKRRGWTSSSPQRRWGSPQRRPRLINTGQITEPVWFPGRRLDLGQVQRCQSGGPEESDQLLRLQHADLRPGREPAGQIPGHD